MFSVDDTRTEVSVNLTKILVLFGRLGPDTNARQLPATLAHIEPLISELEQMRLKDPAFDLILRQSIEVREKHSKVFRIPQVLLADPTIEGLRSANAQLAARVVRSYCRMTKKIFQELGAKATRELLTETVNDCRLIASALREEEPKLIELLYWCEMELRRQ
ncbi:MAG TPA: hypothetical protein VI112_01675 [Bacteroidia bacterium]|jgi:hypothetical protein